MRSTLKRTTLLIAGALLLACADPGRRPEAAAAPAAASASAEDAYVTGRAAHLARRHDAALAAYRAALARDPAHLKARNGLATLYAERGDFARAIGLWQAMAGEGEGADGQASAFLFSNLGYAHFLNGQFEQALAALEKACLLDPLNDRTWDHLGGALQKVGQHQRAQQMFRQAGALRAHDFKADYAVAARAGVSAIDSAVKAGGQASPEPQWDRTEVRQDASGVFVVQRVGAALADGAAAARPALAAVAPVPAAAARPGQALLEIRNGNGVAGMARSLAGTMDQSALRVVRLSNQKGFGVRQTRIEYQPEFREAAERLARRFGAARVVAVGELGRADLRLVIGRDLAPDALAGAVADAPAGAVAVAARTRPLPGQG
ncbi:tetratricopeptide repeat protein [Massilia sp. CCM 8733]|uniref:Tetratricopeptide repeat protein n=1 Tax=Massilia mucilaginosa TaxID=2609282 RepID=A0ABX0NZU8_9BURK|nr:LytR C-terminal domain-containing protein [Massilia mucilaginosa]NHZ92324.1 tetratricopeptide repeat protein [Massilia mucilaginosa]